MRLSWGSPAQADMELLSLDGKPALSHCETSGPQSEKPQQARATGLTLLWGNPG